MSAAPEYTLDQAAQVDSAHVAAENAMTVALTKFAAEIGEGSAPFIQAAWVGRRSTYDFRYLFDGATAHMTTLSPATDNLLTALINFASAEEHSRHGADTFTETLDCYRTAAKVLTLNTPNPAG